MEIPLTRAANRPEVFFAVPMIVACPRHTPDCSTNLREIGPLSAREPASASPNPSRIDFLPSAITSAGMSSYFVRTTNSATYLVRPRVLGKSPGSGLFPARAVFARTEAPIAAREVLPKSRRRMTHQDAQHFRAGCHTRELPPPDRRGEEPPDSSD